MPKRLIRLLLVVALLLVARVVLSPRDTPVTVEPKAPTGATTAPPPSHDALRQLVAAHRSNVEVGTGGRVTRLLADDNEGSRHQKFLIRTGDSVSILVVYNIDLAPRVPVQVGDSVTLRGEYVWNDRGGLIHWTHHDPAQRHEAGWVDVGGRRYQ